MFPSQKWLIKNSSRWGIWRRVKLILNIEILKSDRWYIIESLNIKCCKIRDLKVYQQSFISLIWKQVEANCRRFPMSECFLRAAGYQGVKRYLMNNFLKNYFCSSFSTLWLRLVQNLMEISMHSTRIWNSERLKSYCWIIENLGLIIGKLLITFDPHLSTLCALVGHDAWRFPMSEIMLRAAEHQAVKRYLSNKFLKNYFCSTFPR